MGSDGRQPRQEGTALALAGPQPGLRVPPRGNAGWCLPQPFMGQTPALPTPGGAVQASAAPCLLATEELREKLEYQAAQSLGVGPPASLGALGGGRPDKEAQ